MVIWHSLVLYLIACLLVLLTPRCRVLLQKLTGLQLVKKFPAFHGTRRFITALTSVHHLSLSWASPLQPIYPHPTSWRSILILSIHLRLGLPTASWGLVSLRIVLSPEQASRMWVFLNKFFVQGGAVSISPNPQAGGAPLVGCPRLLIQFIRSYPPYRRLFLYPQPEEEPCRGDRDPLHGFQNLLTQHDVIFQRHYMRIFYNTIQCLHVHTVGWIIV